MNRGVCLRLAGMGSGLEPHSSRVTILGGLETTALGGDAVFGGSTSTNRTTATNEIGIDMSYPSTGIIPTIPQEHRPQFATEPFGGRQAKGDSMSAEGEQRQYEFNEQQS